MAISPRGRRQAEPKEHVSGLDGDNWREAYDGICDYYRLALFNALYCGKRRGQMQNWNLAFEIIIAVGTVVSAGLMAPKLDFVPSGIAIVFASLVAAIAATKPVLKLAARGAQYASREARFRGIYFGYRDLVDVIQLEGRVSQEAWQEHLRLRGRYQDLEVTGGPNPSMRLRRALREEVERLLPVENLKVP